MVRNLPTFEGELEYSDSHDEIFGPGWCHTVYTKCMLIHFEKGLRNFWRNADGTYKKRISRPGGDGQKFEDFFKKHFNDITGFHLSQPQKFKAEAAENNGYLKPRAPKGPEKIKLEERFHQLPQWTEEQVKQASRGSYLTIQRLMKKFKEDFIDACAGPVEQGQEGVQPVMAMPGKEVFRRALHSMNYEYLKRRVKRLDARESEVVLAELDKFLEWIVKNHIYGPSRFQAGKNVYSYNPMLRIGTGDESYMDSTEYRDASWTNAKTRFKDFLAKNKRLAMVHTIFSDQNKEANSDWIVEPAIWSTQWKTKKDGFKYYGKTNAENMEAIYGDALFGLAQGAPEDSKKILFLDNYSAHKRIRKELRGTVEEITTWVTDTDEAEQHVKDVIATLHQSAAQRGMDVERKELFKALKANGVLIYALEVLARDYGAEIKYLPPYYSELNPIELLWAEVKRFYRDDTKTGDDWNIRMDQAWNSITPQFIESCFDRSIRWALKKHKERADAKAKAAAPAAEPAAPEAEEEVDDDDHQIEEFFIEEAIEEMEDTLDD